MPLTGAWKKPGPKWTLMHVNTNNIIITVMTVNTKRGEWHVLSMSGIGVRLGRHRLFLKLDFKASKRCHGEDFRHTASLPFIFSLGKDELM